MDEQDLMHTKGYLPVSTIARWARRHPSRIYMALDAGALEGIRAGRARYVQWESFKRWIARDSSASLEVLGIPETVPPINSSPE